MLINLIGYIGSILIAAQYVLMMIEKVNAVSFMYFFLNFIGSVLILISLAKHTNYPSLGIEIFWLVMSIYGMIRNRDKQEYIKK